MRQSLMTGATPVSCKELKKLKVKDEYATCGLYISLKPSHEALKMIVANQSVEKTHDVA